MIKTRRMCESRVCQGDIIRDIEHIEYVTISHEYVETSTIVFPLVLVLTQDCDLAQDYTVRFSRRDKANDDKRLVSVLVAPIYNVEHVRGGNHLEDIGRKTETINSKQIGSIRHNQTPRYHYIEFPPEVQIVPSVIDFKHYFSVNVDYIKKIKPKNFACKVAEIYREDISLRFANYLSRIGLPDPPKPKPALAALAAQPAV